MVLTSLMVWVAEVLWIDWPGLPYTWAVVLRPWRADQLLWDLSFFATSMTYAAAGLAWGFLSARWLAPLAALTSAPPVDAAAR